MIGLFKLGLTAFGTAGIFTKLIVIAGVFLSITAVLGTIYYNIWSNGYEDGHRAAINEIAAQDEAALSQARAARNRVLGCRATDGMRWNQATGKCEKR